MVIARKVRSAANLLRTKGLADVAELTRIRIAEAYRAHRPLPADPASRARLLAAMLNRHRLTSQAVVLPEHLAGASEAILGPYLRHRLSETTAAVARQGPRRLRPIEAVVAADCLLMLWDFPGIDAALPDWTAAVAGTPFAERVAQVGRRASLRLGRLSDAARDIDALGADVGSLLLRGDILDALGRLDEARAAYEAAIRRDGSSAEARLHYGFNLMKAGHVRDGLASWSAAEGLFGHYPLRRPTPQWVGEPLGARRLMVLFEHGLGDMIQVARFLPRLLAREPEATIMARLPAPLAGLMERAFPAVTFVTEEAREPDYDVFVPSMQLAAVLDAPDLEPRAGYVDLGSPTVRRSAGRPRVGVCWRGHPRLYEFTRSVPLDAFAALFAERDIDFVVLLNRLTPDEQARLAGEANVAVPSIRDFVDLAALVASCDLVVSVDTAVVHLAGAGGAPTLLLSRPDACWRWGTSGSEGPWYSSIEVLRHSGDMDWPHLLADAAERIRARLVAPAAA